MIDPPTEPPFNDRWQAEPDTSWGDRPGIVASLLRYWVVVVAATLLGVLAGYGLAQRLPVRYDAAATLILADPGDPSVLGAGNGLSSDDRRVYLAKQADIMTSTEVLQRAVELLGSNQSVQDIKDQVSAAPSANLASISIAATTGDPGSAVALANAVGTAYEQITGERATADANRTVASLEQLRDRYQADLDALPKSPDGQLTSRQQQLVGQIANIAQREQDITSQVALYASGVQYFEQAEPPTTPSQPRPKLAAALGGLLGLIAAAAWAWWAAARHQRAADRGEPARILEAPLLGEVPPPRAHPVPVGDSANAAELDPELEDSFQLIVATMEHELAGVSGKSIAITGVGADETTTSTTLEIAHAASQQDRRVLLIDADVRTRDLTNRVGHPAAAIGQDGAGRGHRQRGHRPRQEPVGDLSGAALEYVDRLVPTNSGSVLPLTSTTADGGANGAVDVRHAVWSIGDLFDLVLVDAPALLGASNAIGVVGQADAVVLVVPHRTALGDLRDARDRLAFVKTPLLGYVYVRPRRLGRRSKRASPRGQRS